MDQILPDTVPCGGHAFAPSLASPPALVNMDTIDKLMSVDKNLATLIADNQGSTTLVSSSSAGALKAVGHKGDDDSMQIDDVNVSSHVDDKCLPPGPCTPPTSPSISSCANAWLSSVQLLYPVFTLPQHLPAYCSCYLSLMYQTRC